MTAPTHIDEPHQPQDNEIARRRRVNQVAEEIVDLFKDLRDRVLEYKDELGVPTVDWLDLVADNAGSRLLDALLRVGGPALPAIIDAAVTLSQRPPGPGPTVSPDLDLAGLFAQSAESTPENGGLPTILATLMPVAFATLETIRQQREDSNNTGAGVGSAEAGVLRMHATIQRLFAESPKPTNADGSPIAGDQAPTLEAVISLRSGGTSRGIVSTTPEGMLKLMTPETVPDTTPGARAGRTKTVLVEQFFDYSDVVAIAVMREVTAVQGSSIISPS